MSNLSLRIISGLFLISFLIACIYFGKDSTRFLLLFFGVLLIEEWLVHFAKVSRFSLKYIVFQSLFIVPFLLLHYFYGSLLFSNNIIVTITSVLLFLATVYLFLPPSGKGQTVKISKKYPFIGPILALFPFLSLSAILEMESWVVPFVALFLIAATMDTGAYFCGRFLGRHKLWPKVSPNKTHEGLWGGALISALSTSLYWNYFTGNFGIKIFLCFFFLAIASQLGDLFQSKIKRSFSLKDSSALIPGHGGVYDRVDSILFLAPWPTLLFPYLY